MIASRKDKKGWFLENPRNHPVDRALPVTRHNSKVSTRLNQDVTMNVSRIELRRGKFDGLSRLDDLQRVGHTGRNPHNFTGDHR